MTKQNDGLPCGDMVGVGMEYRDAPPKGYILVPI